MTTTTRTLTEYSLTVVDMSDGGDGRIESQIHLTGRDAVKAHLTKIIDAQHDFGWRCNAEIHQDAETAGWALDRWHGDRPLSVRIHTTRWDVAFAR